MLLLPTSSSSSTWDFSAFHLRVWRPLTITVLLWQLWVSTTPVLQSSTSCKNMMCQRCQYIIFHMEILTADSSRFLSSSPRQGPCPEISARNCKESGRLQGRVFSLQELSCWPTYLLGVLWSLGERLILLKKKKNESGSVSMLCFSCGLRDVLQVCNSISLCTLVSLTWLTPLFCLCTIPFCLTQLRNITISCLKMNFPLPV